MTTKPNEALETEGLPILACAPNAPAALAGVRAGDRLLEVNGQKITGIDSFLEAKLRNPKSMDVRLLRAGQIIALTIPFDLTEQLGDASAGALPWPHSASRMAH